MKRFGEFAEQPLVEMDVTDVNTLFKSLESGEHPDVKDSGYQKSTLSQWQSAVTKFYEYHTEL